jgi:hypothetical protein
MNEAAKTASQPLVGDAKRSTTIFVIVFIISLVGVMALWIAFLIWLVIHVLF